MKKMTRMTTRTVQRLGWRLRPSMAAMMLLMLLGVMLGAQPAQAEVVKGEIVSLGIGGINGRGGLYRVGSWVPVRVRLENRSGKQFAGRLGVEQRDLDGDKVLSVGPQVILDPADVEGRDFWLYYWPRPDDLELAGIKSVAVLDETGTQVVATIPVKPNEAAGSGAPGAGAAAVEGIGKQDPNTGRSMRWVVVLGPSPAGFGSFVGSFGGTETVRLSLVSRAEGMPDNVLGLDGVDTVVWEADELRPSDLSADFQLKALLEWVRAGGHLVISVSSQGQEFLKAGGALRDAMPIIFTGVRELKVEDLQGFVSGADLSGISTPISQAVGTLRADARPIGRALSGIFADAPLAVTGIYGRGAVTVLTIDATSGGLEHGLNEHHWIQFWNQVAGWNGSQTEVKPRAEYENEQPKTVGSGSAVTESVTTPTQFRIGEAIPRLIDVSEETNTRILVTVMFLLLYWLAAGPIGHLVLRAYKVVHWSWWVFGGTVVVATLIAGGVVAFLELTNYDLRHQSIMLGTVNSNQVTVAGYYGVFAPVSGTLAVEQPASPDGMNYLAPMCMPTLEPVKPFADPQSYTLFNEKPNVASVVFRNTLKKMQGRWSGTHGGIDGAAEYVKDEDRPSPLKGTLTNHSGYDLHDVEFILHSYEGRGKPEGTSRLYWVGEWKAGAALDLSKALKLELLADQKAPVTLEDMLQWLGHQYEDSGGIASPLGQTHDDIPEQYRAIVGGRSENLLYLFLNARQQDQLADTRRVEPVRSFTRIADCTKALYAAGGMIIARSRSASLGKRVASPVPITVNGRAVAGEGDVLFAWALPLPAQITFKQTPLLGAGVRPTAARGPHGASPAAEELK